MVVRAMSINQRRPVYQYETFGKYNEREGYNQMTLKELLDKVTELYNEETKDLEIRILTYGEEAKMTDIWLYELKNDYTEFREIRII